MPEATRTLRILMANSLALKMNFAGRGDKVGIAALKITKVIISMLVVCFHFLGIWYSSLLGENTENLIIISLKLCFSTRYARVEHRISEKQTTLPSLRS